MERAPEVFAVVNLLMWQYICSAILMAGEAMARTKNEVLTIRTTAEVKDLLKLAAERERRSAASMVEILVLEYAEAHGLAAPESGPLRKGDGK